MQHFPFPASSEKGTPQLTSGRPTEPVGPKRPTFSAENVLDRSDTPTEPFGEFRNFQNFRNFQIIAERRQQSLLPDRMPEDPRLAHSAHNLDAVVNMRSVCFARSETPTEHIGTPTEPFGTFGVSDLSAERYRSVMLSVGVGPFGNFAL